MGKAAMGAWESSLRRTESQGRGMETSRWGVVHVGVVEVCLGDQSGQFVQDESTALDRGSPEPGCSWCQVYSCSRVLGVRGPSPGLRFKALDSNPAWPLLW